MSLKTSLKSSSNKIYLINIRFTDTTKEVAPHQKMETDRLKGKPTRPSRSSTQSSGSSSSSSSSSSTSSSSSSASDSDSSGSSDDENIDKEGTKNVVETLQAAESAKQQYRKQKPTFLKLVNENEKLQEELKRKQKQLLKINLDKYFLFERLLSYEKPPPRKYTKQNKNKTLPDSEMLSADDHLSHHEVMTSNSPKTSTQKAQKHKTTKVDVVGNEEENLEIEVDTEEDTGKSNGISLLKQSSGLSGAQTTELNLSDRRKYKKRRKSAQNVEETGQVGSRASSGSDVVPGGTSLLLSSFSSQASSKQLDMQ